MATKVFIAPRTDVGDPVPTRTPEKYLLIPMSDAIRRELYMGLWESGETTTINVNGADSDGWKVAHEPFIEIDRSSGKPIGLMVYLVRT